MEVNLTKLRDEIQKDWSKIFGLDYFAFFIKDGRVFGTKFWSNRGDTENVELKVASKYEITIESCYLQIYKLLSEKPS